MKKFSLYSLIPLLLIPATLLLGTKISGKSHYLISSLIVIKTMIPFFLSFEKRKPQARELVTVAVLCALSVASRVVIQIPHFKPTIGVIMLSAAALGAEAGFMTGAVTAFASNFFFSQGPWTPWQMFAYGMAGFLSGLLFSGKRPFVKRSFYANFFMAVFGFFLVILVVGPLLDTCTLFTTASRITPQYAIAVYAAGFPANLSNGVATFVTVILFGRPLLEKLDRLKTKYGILQ